MSPQINYDSKILTQNIKELRKRNRLNKKQMANLLGISIYSLNKIENGILPKQTTIELLISIKEAFGISPHEIMQNLIFENKKL